MLTGESSPIFITVLGAAGRGSENKAKSRRYASGGHDPRNDAKLQSPQNTIALMRPGCGHGKRRRLNSVYLSPYREAVFPHLARPRHRESPWQPRYGLSPEARGVSAAFGRRRRWREEIGSRPRRGTRNHLHRWSSVMATGSRR